LRKKFSIEELPEERASEDIIIVFWGSFWRLEKRAEKEERI